MRIIDFLQICDGQQNIIIYGKYHKKYYEGKAYYATVPDYTLEVVGIWTQNDSIVLECV